MSSSPLCRVLAGARLHHSPTAIKEEVLPRKDQPEFQYWHYWPHVAYLHQIHGNASERRSASRQQLTSQCHRTKWWWASGKVRWPLHIDGAVRQCCIHRCATVQELDDMLKEYDMKRDSVEINHNAPNGPTTQCGTGNTWNRSQDAHCGPLPPSILTNASPPHNQLLKVKGVS